ncbi:MAG TPA: LTA synthase family protein [Candidatus Paceibacterota bacterium]|nr:LTA synthase family protein [Candidatus Paceibacterota bacterium]
MKYNRIVEIVWLPTVLAVLLVVETLFFNWWLDIAWGSFMWRCIAASVGLGVALFFPAVFFAKRYIRYAYLAVLSLLVNLIFISQFLYYRYSGGFLQASSLVYSGQSVDLLSTIKTLLTYKLLFFTAPLLILIVGYIAIDTGAQKKRLTLKEKAFAFLLMLIVFCGGYGELIVSEHFTFGSAKDLYDSSDMYNLSSLVAKVGIVNFYTESLIEYALQPRVANADDISFLTAWAKRRTLPLANSDFGALKGKNLIFIQVESLENWVIGYKINGIEVAPNLTELSQEGTYFINYYSQDGEGNTADAEFSTQNSLYPLPDAVAFTTYAENTYDALPHVLDSNGYTTAAMHGDVATFWNRSNAYPSLGYEDVFSKPDYVVPRQVGPEGLGDDDFFEQSLPKLESLPQPFMATLITLSTHTPFTLPADLETLSIPTDTTLTPTQQQYLEAVHYSDRALGNFIDGLKKDGLYDNSLIVIYGDHGAFIGTSDSQNQHVPLIVLAPGTALPKGVDTTPGSHLDLYPTVADLLGIQYPITVLGQDLFTTQTPVVTQRVPGTGAIKFIIGSNMQYIGSVDGTFGHGTCTTFPALAPLPVASCQTLWSAQVQNTEASDLIVRYNLLPLVASQT